MAGNRREVRFDLLIFGSCQKEFIVWSNSFHAMVSSIMAIDTHYTQKKKEEIDVRKHLILNRRILDSVKW